MSLTLLNTLSKVITAMCFHGSIIYAGTENGSVYSLTTSGATTFLINAGSKVTGLTINYPKLYISTNKGKVYDYDISASSDPIIGPIIGASANVYGSGVALNRTTVTSGARVHSDDGGAVLWGTGSVPDIRGQLSRLLLTKDNTGGFIRVHALMGQLKGQDAFWNSEVVSATHGRLEIVRSAATVVLGGYGVSSALLGVVATSGAITVNTNHILAGVTSLADFRATLTQTGKTVAFLAKAYDTTNWSDATARTTWGFGLYMPRGSVTQGIRIGDWVGSQASGSAILFSTGMDFYGDGQLDVAQFFAESTGDLTSAYSAKAGRFRHLVSCASDTVINQECYGVVGQVVMKNASMNHYAGGVMGTMESGTLFHIQTGYASAAVIGRVGTPYCTVESGGLLAAVLALSNLTDTSFTHTGPYAAFAARTVAGKHAFTSLIEVPSDLANAQNATGVPGANPMAITISVNGVTKYLLCADSWATP